MREGGVREGSLIGRVEIGARVSKIYAHRRLAITVRVRAREDEMALRCPARWIADEAKGGSL